MKSKDIVIVGILLGIGAIARYVSLVVGGPITSNLVIAFYALAILLVVPKIREALGIGIVAGIICALISHSLFPPANLISEPIGALVAILVILGIDRLIGTKERKDHVIGYLITAIGMLGMLLFTVFFVLDQYKVMAFPMLTSSTGKIAFSAISIVITLVGLYFIPGTLRKFKAAIVALLATLASGLSFILLAAFVIFNSPGMLNSAYTATKGVPAIDVFILASLPIVIGCAILNMIIAQVLYIPAKKAMR
jgi:hypothetical protein